MDWLVIGIAALLTSVISALAGLGGGIILLAVILQFFAPVTAIPIHGSIQLMSNASRATILRKSIEWGPVGWQSILLVPAALLGVKVATSLPEQAMRLVLGVFVLIVAWRPQLLKWRGGQRLPDQALIGVGAVSGFLSATIGASGPVTSPFFKAVTATHMSFVATAGASQVLGHMSKVLAFSTDGFRIGDHLPIVIAGILGVLGGTWLGTRLLGHIPESSLNKLFRFVLTALALRLIIGALRAI